jgi:hypothetical protein
MEQSTGHTVLRKGWHRQGDQSPPWEQLVAGSTLAQMATCAGSMPCSVFYTAEDQAEIMARGIITQTDDGCIGVGRSGAASDRDAGGDAKRARGDQRRSNGRRRGHKGS